MELKGTLGGQCRCKTRDNCWHRVCDMRLLSSGSVLLDNGSYVRLVEATEVMVLGKGPLVLLSGG